MTMFDTSIIIFEDGALDDIEKFSGPSKNECYDPGFIKKSYGTNFGRIPESWYGYLGKGHKMDWGSYLYVCNRDLLERLLELENTFIWDRVFGQPSKKIDFSEIPKCPKYGILEVEEY